MKNFLFSIVSGVLYFAIVGSVYAYDMEVQCNDIKCNVSSNEPIFKADTSWSPGKIIKKEIIIKNTGDKPKEVFLRVKTEESTGSLDDYMTVTLLDLNGNSIWSGTLAEFINDETILIDSFTKDEEFLLGILAKMDDSTPNNLQGGSSVFDFGFGFEGDLSESNNTNSNNSNSSSSSSDSGGGNAANPVGQILEGISTFFLGNEADASNETDGDIAGESDDRAISEPSVMGVLDECSNNNLWIVVLIIQAMISIVYFLNKVKKRVSVLINFAFFVIASVLIYLVSCILWPIVISVAIFLVPIVYSRRKELRRKLSFK